MKDDVVHPSAFRLHPYTFSPRKDRLTMAIDPRFLAESGREVFIGNELLVKGALETDGGVHLMTGYPGSPVAGFFDCLGDIADLLKSKGVRAFQANNEALGVAAVNGSQMAPMRSICAFKSVGTHVASDALALGTLAGTHPDGGAPSRRRGGHHQRRRPLVRINTGPRRQPLPLRARAHGRRRAGHVAGAE